MNSTSDTASVFLTTLRLLRSFFYGVASGLKVGTFLDMTEKAWLEFISTTLGLIRGFFFLYCLLAWQPLDYGMAGGFLDLFRPKYFPIS